MKKLALVIGLILTMGITPAFADDHLPIGNDVPAWFETFKTVIDHLDPGYEQTLDLNSGEWFHGFSGSLFNITDDEIGIGSIRAGYAVDYKIYSSLRFDLVNISRKYIPEIIKAPATVGFLDTLWSVAGKYGNLGLTGGYDFDSDDPIIGITVGGVFKF